MITNNTLHTSNTGYDSETGLSVLELPYTGKDIAMYIFLPRDGSSSSFDQMLDSLNSNKIENLLQNMRPTKLYVYLPKFSIKTSVDEELITVRFFDKELKNYI